MRTLVAYLNETRVGVLSESDDLWRFEYDRNWVNASGSFDLSPALKRTQLLHQDGSSLRTVQWYFDNLLPEENLRSAVCKEAKISVDDAFALLEFLGTESAGSLILLPADQELPAHGGLRELADQELCQRIVNLPRATLSSGAAKRMSVAGAQNKLLVVVRDGKIFEPVGAQPSTFILKPNHVSSDYPASVMNEYVTMSLAHKLKLRVPAVYRRYTPEPVYLVERFDRYTDSGNHTRRRHIIDSCQLLNKSRSFKYQAATLETLADIVMQCQSRAGNPRQRNGSKCDLAVARFEVRNRMLWVNARYFLR